MSNSLEESIYLQADYHSGYKEIHLTANASALVYLQKSIQALLDAGVAHKHLHFDRTSGLEGNVASLIIEFILETPGE